MDKEPKPRQGETHGEPETERDPLSETSFTDESEDSGLDQEERMEFLFEQAEVSDDEVMEEISRYTDDPEILEDFAERQGLDSGAERLLDRLERHNSKSPNLAAEDVDARWDQADQSGEESVGGSNPTPDQDRVEELGEAVGLDYDDDEPLNTFDKLSRRDQNRWELEPESMLDMADDQIPAEDTPFAEELAEADVLPLTGGAPTAKDIPAEEKLERRRNDDLAEDDSLGRDRYALGDAAFPQEVDDENDDEGDL